jgi:hypothetical protein
MVPAEAVPVPAAATISAAPTVADATANAAEARRAARAAGDVMEDTGDTSVLECRHPENARRYLSVAPQYTVSASLNRRLCTTKLRPPCWQTFPEDLAGIMPDDRSSDIFNQFQVRGTRP